MSSGLQSHGSIFDKVLFRTPPVPVRTLLIEKADEGSLVNICACELAGAGTGYVNVSQIPDDSDEEEVPFVYFCWLFTPAGGIFVRQDMIRALAPLCDDFRRLLTGR